MSTLVKVEDLREGDLVDLEGDPYAAHCELGPSCLDCESARMRYEMELVEVMNIEQETPDCVAVGFDGAWIGFPTGHQLPTTRGSDGSPTS